MLVMCRVWSASGVPRSVVEGVSVAVQSNFVAMNGRVRNVVL